MPDIPSTTEDASPAFLTEVLRVEGVIGPETAVAEIEHEPIGVGVGIVGQLARLHLRYQGEAAGAPGSVVLKIPSQFPENRAVGDHFKFYEREGRFYQEIAGKMPVRVPACYWNHIDPESGTFALVMEDLSNRVSISQIAGAGHDRAAQALGAIAGLHAAWWNSPTLDTLGWMPYLDDPINLSAGEQYRLAWPRFVELFGDALPPGSIALGERIQVAFEDLMRIGTSEAPTTVCHGDFRLDNLLFDDSIGDDGVAVVDWQIAYRGPAISDVAYFLCQSLEVPTRQAHEPALVRGWYDAVVERRGGEAGDELEGYPFDLVWEQYRRSALATTVYAVIPGGGMDPANDRGRELIATMGRRVFSAVVQLGAETLLP
jgi:aminoglycoside phosphotransferase (APT) family kinase protein